MSKMARIPEVARPEFRTPNDRAGAVADLMEHRGFLEVAFMLSEKGRKLEDVMMTQVETAEQHNVHCAERSVILEVFRMIEDAQKTLETRA